MPAHEMIHIEKLRFAYREGNETLRLDDLSVPRNGRLLVLGPSGCGKTTLLHLMAGLLSASAGSVLIDGQNLAQFSASARDQFRGKNIGVVLQQFHLLPTLTAIQNLLVAQSMAGLPVDAEAARHILASLGVYDRAYAYPYELSVGQQQRVAIARALVNSPKVVLADEPTSNLDDEACAAVIDLLLESADRQGSALVIATHDSRLKSRVAAQLILPRSAVANASEAVL